MTLPKFVGIAVAALLLAGGGKSTRAVALAAEAEPGCEVTNQALAAELGYPRQTFVDDARRVCQGGWAYWPARATGLNEEMLVYKSAQTGQISLIGLGHTSCEANKSPDTTPVPPRVQRAKGC